MSINERDELRWHSGRYSWLESRRGYSLGYDGALKGARWTIHKVDASTADPAVPRDDEFREDLLIPRQFRSSLADYVGSELDRGHLCPAGDRRENETWQSDTFLLSNMSPQVPGFNRGKWKWIETKIRELGQQDNVRAVWCISLCLFQPGKMIDVIGHGNVPVPHAYAKSILAECNGGRLKLWNYSIENDASAELQPQNIEFLERWAGVPLFDRLATRDKHAMQQRKDWWD